MPAESRTALAGLAGTPGQPFEHGDARIVRLRELPPPALINLRGMPDDPAFEAGVREVLGVALPRQPNTTAQAADWIALWLAPDEWLLRSASEPAHAAPTLERLEQQLAGRFFAATDQSDGHAVLRLCGPRAEAVLRKGCPLDVHPRALATGHCAQSHWFKAGITLRRLDPAHAWELVVRRSFARYAVELLVDAMAEFL